jgi:hypothetical protein
MQPAAFAVKHEIRFSGRAFGNPNAERLKSGGFDSFLSHRLDKVDDPAAQTRALDPREGLGELNAFARGKEVGNIGRRARIREAGRRQIASGRAIEKERDRHIEHLGDLL